jgi:hypothetical protein
MQTYETKQHKLDTHTIQIIKLSTVAIDIRISYPVQIESNCVQTCIRLGRKKLRLKVSRNKNLGKSSLRLKHFPVKTTIIIWELKYPEVHMIKADPEINHRVMFNFS